MNVSLHWEIRWPRRVRTAGDAVRFINAAGFCMLSKAEAVAAMASIARNESKR